MASCVCKRLRKLLPKLGYFPSESDMGAVSSSDPQYSGMVDGSASAERGRHPASDVDTWSLKLEAIILCGV